MVRIEDLTHKNFQTFLEDHRSIIFVDTDPDSGHPQYFPVAKLTEKARVSSRFSRQVG